MVPFKPGDKVIYTSPGGRKYSAEVVSTHQLDAFPAQAEIRCLSISATQTVTVWVRDLKEAK